MRWTAPAYEDLIEILEFVSIDRSAAARKLGQDLLKRSKTLGRNSLRGRILPELLQQGITATVVVQEPVRYFALERDALVRLLRADHDIARAVDQGHRRNLENKLVRMNEALGRV